MITFIPKNKTEESWKVMKYRSDYNDLSQDIMLYSTGKIRRTKHIVMMFIPINNIKKIYLRGIIYILRDRDLDDEINIYDLEPLILTERNYTIRAIQKFWSERPFETDREHFLKHYNYVQNFGIQFKPKSLRLAVNDLIQMGVFEIIKKTKKYRTRYFNVKLTELGKKIVKLHRDHNFVF